MVATVFGLVPFLSVFGLVCIPIAPILYGAIAARR